MKTLRLTIAALFAVSGWVLSQEAGAADAPAALKAGGCLTCHDMEKKKVGPPLKDANVKNKGKGGELAAKMTSGKGHPKVKASEADIKAAVDSVVK